MDPSFCCETVSPSIDQQRDPIRSFAAFALDAARSSILYSHIIPALEELDKRDDVIAARRRFATPTGCGLSEIQRMRVVPYGLVQIRVGSRYTRYTRRIGEVPAYIPAIRIRRDSAIDD